MIWEPFMERLGELRAALSGAIGDHDPEMTIMLPAETFDSLAAAISPQAREVMTQHGGAGEIIIHGVSVQRDHP